MRTPIFLCLTALLLAAPAIGADYRVEVIEESAPTDAVSDAISGKLSKTGIRVIRGTKTTLCDIWLLAETPAKAEFKATPEVSYPFTPGQLLGVVRFARRGSDFRDQDIDKGVYTIRYGLQPVDGAHVGTSLTRDFMLLLQAERDQSVDPLDYDTLTVNSSEAAQTNHPCLLSMRRPSEGSEFPRIRHEEEHDWWIVSAQGKAGGKPLPLEFVVVGYIEE